MRTFHSNTHCHIYTSSCATYSCDTLSPARTHAHAITIGTHRARNTHQRSPVPSHLARRKQKSGQFQHALCSCCKVKGCGLECCIANTCCAPCVVGAIMEKGGLGFCEPWCMAQCGYGGTICSGAVPGVLMRNIVVAKYGIDEPGCNTILCATCCPLCSYYQVAHEVLTREKLTWTYCGVTKGGKAKKSKGSPKSKSMARA